MFCLRRGFFLLRGSETSLALSYNEILAFCIITFSSSSSSIRRSSIVLKLLVSAFPWHELERVVLLQRTLKGTKWAVSLSFAVLTCIFSPLVLGVRSSQWEQCLKSRGILYRFSLRLPTKPSALLHWISRHEFFLFPEPPTVTGILWVKVVQSWC
jgi:hypothetical protein